MSSRPSLNSNIVFSGIQGKVLLVSPHGNYLVVKLSKRILICGTYSNQWNWEENFDSNSGFTAFITYIGVSKSEEEKFRELIYSLGGSIRELRKSKRTQFPMEFKIDNLTVDSVVFLSKLKANE